LLIAEVVKRFKKIGSFVRKHLKLAFKLENKRNRLPIINSPKILGNAQIPRKGANSVAPHKNSAAHRKLWFYYERVRQ